jgi:hypothetical protein
VDILRTGVLQFQVLGGKALASLSWNCFIWGAKGHFKEYGAFARSWRKTTRHGPRRTIHDGNRHIME